MLPYIMVAVTIFYGYIKQDENNIMLQEDTSKVSSLKNGKYVNFLLVVLYIFVAFRNPYILGTDGISYKSYFDNYIPTLSNFNSYDHTYEIGYAFINSIAKTIYNDYIFFQITYNILSTWLLSKVLKNLEISENEKCLFLFIYFTYRYFQNSMEFLRQNIAILIVWIMLLKLNDEMAKYKVVVQTVVLGLCAWSFHRSALFMIFAALIINKIKTFDKNNLAIGTIILSTICYFIPIQGINYLINLAVNIGGDRYAQYLLDDETAYYTINLVNYAIRLIFFLLLIVFYENIDYKKKDLILAISSFALVVGSINTGIFTRLLEYGMIGIYMCITLSPAVISSNSKRLYKLIIFAAFLIILIRNLHSVSGGTYLNYEWFFL